MSGRSKPYFFSFNTTAKPGKVIAHCVRFETMELPVDQFQQSQFTLLGADIDKDERIKVMVECVRSRSYG